jgi:hypothetical protein
LLKKPDDPVGTIGQPERPTLIPNVTTRPNLLDIVRLGPYRPHGFVLGDHTWSQTRLTSQQPALLIRLATKSSPADVGYHTKSVPSLKS